MNRRTFVVAALAWVLVVTLGSGLVWAVISSAGQDTGITGQPLRTGETPLLGVATQTTGRPSPRPGHDGNDGHGGDDHGHDGHHGSGGDGPDGQPTGGQATSGSGNQGGSGSSSPGGSGGSKTSNPSPDGPATVSRIWNGAAGSVKVECTGATIRLVSAYPNDGYRYEVSSSGPEHVEVEFENTSTERQTKFEATCSSGSPVFRVETDSDSGGDD
ncbi:hypothetical protein [Nocardioides taihuensis]|uniref:Uncharacterized protein n=1 Tax=Nocardioides taihuensis TaxID=1835606 RepID=A0ABW0BLM8_9ACTN